MFFLFLQFLFLHQLLFYGFCFVKLFENNNFVLILSRNTVCGLYAGWMFLEGARLTIWHPCCPYDGADRITMCMLSYTIGDVLLMRKFPIFSQVDTWAHHVTSCVLIVYSSYNPNVSYFALHLCGIGELSTIMLCVADTFKNIPVLRRRSTRLNSCARVGFAISFFAVRVLWWSYIILYSAVILDQNKYVRCCLYGLLLLQYYWATWIIRSMKICSCPQKNS